jgi:lipopolysaccharide/colanic/teichoic acid biosynthesis glycosyltransferase
MPSDNNSPSTTGIGGKALALPTWKRLIDLTCCCAALPILAIATFFMAILMSVTSPGPIFFRQERVGFMGRRFRLYKFRTMHVGADTSSHQTYFTALMKSDAPMQKLDSKGDSRLIAGGWLIRSAGLDELPQMINILRGEMSLVGPRPCIPYEFEGYTSEQRARFNTAPGLTGLWQVSGKNRTTFDQMIQLDLRYVAQRSLGLDLTILVKTLPAIVSQIAQMCRLRKAPQPTAAKPSSSHVIPVPNGKIKESPAMSTVQVPDSASI